MAEHKFVAGQTLYYKPADFAPLQVSAGGECQVIRALNGIDDEFEYVIALLDTPGELIAKEHELSVLKDRV
jgi:hypothetical protein